MDFPGEEVTIRLLGLENNTPHSSFKNLSVCIEHWECGKDHSHHHFTRYAHAIEMLSYGDR